MNITASPQCRLEVALWPDAFDSRATRRVVQRRLRAGAAQPVRQRSEAVRDSKVQRRVAAGLHVRRSNSQPLCRCVAMQWEHARFAR